MEKIQQTQVKWKWFVGWMMSVYLLFADDIPIENTYSVTITGLTKEQADALVSEWGDDRAFVSVG